MQNSDSQLSIKLKLGGGRRHEHQMTSEGDERADDHVVVAPKQRGARQGVDAVGKPNERARGRGLERNGLGEDDRVAGLD